ncbi:hypothetical protein EON66_05325 [archaeon]|nr:MAG: hypothetical protein EON66_05325 [archaeon]
MQERVYARYDAVGRQPPAAAGDAVATFLAHPLSPTRTASGTLLLGSSNKSAGGRGGDFDGAAERSRGVRSAGAGSSTAPIIVLPLPASVINRTLHHNASAAFGRTSGKDNRRY